MGRLPVAELKPQENLAAPAARRPGRAGTALDARGALRYETRPFPDVESYWPRAAGRVGTMRRRACLLGILLAAGLTAGCVERKYTVYSDVPGALVLVNDEPLGKSPADGAFVYYGKYNFTLMAPGFETLHVREDIQAPWYQWWPLDFFFENLWPFEIEDVRQFHYHLEPMPVPNTEDVLRRSGLVRQQGQAIRQAPTAPADAATQTTSVPPQGEAPPAQMPREGDK
jgi:hypothetical protein